MDTQTLERLLMDRALGVLPADVEALLAAYLEQEPSAAQRAGEFARAAAAARRLLHSDAPASLPPFPAVRIRHLQRTRRQLRWIRTLGGLAATVVLGVGLGVMFRDWRASPPLPAGLPGASQERQYAGAALLRSEGFWSVSRLHAWARRSDPSRTSNWSWKSTVSRPKLGGEL